MELPDINIDFTNLANQSANQIIDFLMQMLPAALFVFGIFLVIRIGMNLLMSIGGR